MLGVMNASLVYLVLRTEDPPWKAEIDAPDVTREELRH
jgi:hypothetical protein